MNGRSSFNAFISSGVPPGAAGQVGGRIISETRWTTLGDAGTQLFRFIVSLSLARLLAPSEFGLMAMALVVVGFVDLFKGLGTTSALIQVKDISPDLLNGVFYLNLLIGIVGGASLLFLAPVMARMYGQSDLTSILRVMALFVVISSASLAQRGLLLRRLRFARMAAIDLTSALVHGVTAVTLAIIGFSVWSLVLGILSGAVVTNLLLWTSSAWRPGLSFRVSELKGIAHFSLNMTCAQVFGYLITQADRLLIGVFLGDVALGLYSMAHNIMDTALAYITTPVTKVLFPAFVGIQEDNEQIVALYSRACGAIAFAAFPLLGGLALLADPMVVIVLGDRWRPLIPVMVILTLPKIVQSLAMTVGTIYQAKGRADWLFGWGIFAGLSTMLAFLIGVQWGIVGVATAYAIVTSLLTYPAFVIPFRLIELPVKSFFRSLIPYTVGTALMLMTVLGAKSLLHGLHAVPYMVLLLSMVSGAVTYLVIVSLLKAPALSDISDFFLVRRLRSKNRTA